MATLGELQAQRQQFFKQKGEQQTGQIAGQTQGNVEALQRRFTSMGAANTGAAIGAEQQVRDQGLAQQRQASTDLAGQQLQSNEGDIARQFGSEESQRAREGGMAESALGRKFAGEQAALAQQGGAAEALKAREFAGQQAAAGFGEAEKARQFQGGLAGQDIAFKRELAGTEQTNKLAEIDLAKQQFALDKDTTAFNQRLASIESGLGDPNAPIAGVSPSVNSISPDERKAQILMELNRRPSASDEQRLIKEYQTLIFSN